MRDQIGYYLDRAQMAARAGVIGRVTEVLPVARVAAAGAGAHLPRQGRRRSRRLRRRRCASRARSRTSRRCSATSSTTPASGRARASTLDGQRAAGRGPHRPPAADHHGRGRRPGPDRGAAPEDRQARHAARRDQARLGPRPVDRQRHRDVLFRAVSRSMPRRTAALLRPARAAGGLRSAGGPGRVCWSCCPTRAAMPIGHDRTFARIAADTMAGLKWRGSRAGGTSAAVRRREREGISIVTQIVKMCRRRCRPASLLAALQRARQCAQAGPGPRRPARWPAACSAARWAAARQRRRRGARRGRRRHRRQRDRPLAGRARPPLAQQAEMRRLRARPVGPARRAGAIPTTAATAR